MNRKRKIRQLRKNLMRMGKIVREEVLKTDDDGITYPKKEWGYCIELYVNGWNICAPDHDKYNAYKGAYFAAKWAMEEKAPERNNEEDIPNDEA